MKMALTIYIMLVLPSLAVYNGTIFLRFNDNTWLVSNAVFTTNANTYL